MTEKHKDLNIYELFPYDEEKQSGFFVGDNLPIEDYMSFSKIREFNESPAHFKWSYIDGNKKQKNKSMEFGDLVHRALLEPTDFKEIFVLYPEKESIEGVLDKTKDLKYELKKHGLKVSGSKKDLAERLISYCSDYKEKIFYLVEKEFNESLKENQLIVKPEDADALVTILNRVAEHPIASKLVGRGSSEVKAFWKDEKLGVTWFAIMDYIRLVETASGDYIAWITELKTTTSAKPQEYRRKIGNMRWHIQLWIYQRVIQGILGPRAQVRIVQMVVESKPPYIVEMFEPVERMMIEAAQYQVRNAIERMHNCFDTDTWPGYSNGRINELDLPPYEYYAIEEEREALNEQ